jgi:hypothetical protein
MRLRWPGLFSAKPQDVEVRYDRLQAAPEFLFRQWPFDSECVDRTPGQHLQMEGQLPYVRTRLEFAGQAPYRRTRLEDITLSRAEVPALTIVANPSQSVGITGSDRDDWSLRFCAYGPRIGRMLGAGGGLIVEAPPDAPITVHASFAPVEVRNMTGPVRVTSIHARAKILNAASQVDAASFGGFRGVKGPRDPERRSRDQFEADGRHVPWDRDCVGARSCPGSRSSWIPNPISSRR